MWYYVVVCLLVIDVYVGYFVVEMVGCDGYDGYVCGKEFVDDGLWFV